MSFREITMQDVREVLRRRQAGQSARRIARETGLDRKTVGRYLEQAAAEVVLLDAMQSFFTYHFYSKCGIPQIVLEASAPATSEAAPHSSMVLPAISALPENSSNRPPIPSTSAIA